MHPGPEAREQHVLLVGRIWKDLDDAHGYGPLLQGDGAESRCLQGVLSCLLDRIVVMGLQDGGLLYAEVADVPGDRRKDRCSVAGWPW